MFLKSSWMLLGITALTEGFTSKVLPTRSRLAQLARSQCSPLKMANPSTAQEGSVKRSSMAAKDPKNIRNVAIVGHSHSGKTALVEWMLYDENILTKKPSNGEFSLDFDPTETARHSSVFSHFVRVPHRSTLLEIADTPWGDFPLDALAAVDGADSAVIVVSAADGVQSGTIHAFQHCQKTGIKSMIALSKMDRPFVRAEEVLEGLEQWFGVTPVPLQVAVMEGDEFMGVKSLLVLGEDGKMQKNEEEGLNDAWVALEEAVAMTDDDLLVDYLENGALEPWQVFNGLRSGVRKNKILPLVYTSAEHDLGVSELMDAIVAVLPNPIEMREEALNAACEADDTKCGLLEPAVEVGFAARVLHTTIDSFGSLSVLRVISNSRSDDAFEGLPHEAINLRTGDKIKMPSTSNCAGLNGKERVPLPDDGQIIPGDIIAVPKLPDAVRTNDVLTIPTAVKDEEEEILIESATDHLTPLSRPAEDIPLMASATVSLPDHGTKKGKSSASDDKLSTALKALAREDLAVRVEQDATSGKLLLHCMSKDHLHLISTRLQDRYGLEVVLGEPPVQYRETLIKTVTNVEGRHKKQSGGSGQFGVCYITMEPLEEGTGIEFESKIKGGVISKPFISSVEKGVREQLAAGGPLAGYPVTDVKITLTDGKMHSVDSKDIAFQSAGKLAVKAALRQGGTKLLQPMEKVTFVVDEKLQGEINAIVSRQEGYVTSTGPGASGLEIEAILPTAAISEVSDVLRATSAGEGQYTSEFSHYQPVAENLIKGIIEAKEEKLAP